MLDALLGAGWRGLSPEASAAAATFRAVAHDLPAALRGCASGRELIAMGYPDDVDIAAELDSSRRVPLLRAGAFQPDLR